MQANKQQRGRGTQALSPVIGTGGFNQNKLE
jgi:hypothetical protein